MSTPVRILFVDDEPSIRKMISMVLELAGFEVQLAEDGVQALNVLSKSVPDIVVSDLRMPNMNGFELLRTVHEKYPDVRTIALSGEYSPDALPDRLVSDAFFEKANYSHDELIEKIEELVRSDDRRHA